jgi:hypothetical protein
MLQMLPSLSLATAGSSGFVACCRAHVVQEGTCFNLMSFSFQKACKSSTFTNHLLVCVNCRQEGYRVILLNSNPVSSDGPAAKASAAAAAAAAAVEQPHHQHHLPKSLLQQRGSEVLLGVLVLSSCQDGRVCLPNYTAVVGVIGHAGRALPSWLLRKLPPSAVLAAVCSFGPLDWLRGAQPSIPTCG